MSLLLLPSDVRCADAWRAGYDLCPSKLLRRVQGTAVLRGGHTCHLILYMPPCVANLREYLLTAFFWWCWSALLQAVHTQAQVLLLEADAVPCRLQENVA